MRHRQEHERYKKKVRDEAATHAPKRKLHCSAAAFTCWEWAESAALGNPRPSSGADSSTYRYGEIIALDLQPFSPVQDEFTRLLNQLERRYTVPSPKFCFSHLYECVKSEVKKKIDRVPYFSFTTDVWTAEFSNDSLLRLTAHWLTDTFQKHAAVLHIQPLTE